MKLFLIVVGATTTVVVMLYITIFLTHRILYSVGITIFHIRLIQWKNLPGKRWKTFKFVINLTLRSFFEDHISSARARHLSWEPYFKFTDHRKATK